MTSTFSTNGINETSCVISRISDQVLLSAAEQDEQDSTASLRARGLIRVHGIIAVDLNERLKAMARKQGRNADQLIGELLEKSAADVDRWEAEQEVIRLRERFGAKWIDVLRQADRMGGASD
jgi:predicted DNA-binding protein